MNPIRNVLNISLFESSHHVALIATHQRYLRAVQTYLNCATACYILHCGPYFSFKPWCWSLHMWLLLPGLGKKCQFCSNSSTRDTWMRQTLKFTRQNFVLTSQAQLCQQSPPSGSGKQLHLMLFQVLWLPSIRVGNHHTQVVTLQRGQGSGKLLVTSQVHNISTSFWTTFIVHSRLMCSHFCNTKPRGFTRLTVDELEDA